MILNRRGSKKNQAKYITPHFPEHRAFVEPFFGAGGMYFKKVKSKFNFLNDADHEIYHLFRTVLDHPKKLYKYLRLTPITVKQFNEWSKGKTEKKPVMRAVRFLILSNFGLFGDTSTMRLGMVNTKQNILDNIERTLLALSDAQITCFDFEKFLNSIDYGGDDRQFFFVYCDPPYLDTDGRYIDKWTINDTSRLFHCLLTLDVKFAVSEFAHPHILDIAERNGLNVIYVNERRNIKSKNTEILVTNYKNSQKLLF